MTNEDIIRITQEAGIGVKKDLEDWHVPVWHLGVDYLVRFAHLIEQHLIQQGYRQCAKGQRTTQFCALLEEAVRQRLEGA
jgi:hypothetical protein